MGGERVLVEVEDGVADVRLNRPDKMNALDRAMLDALVETGERLRAWPGLRAVVLSGEGRAFSAGLDLSSFAAVAARGPSAIAADLGARTHGDANLFQQVALTWRRLPVPVIAALSGAVFGGGLQIALGADLRIASADAQLCVMEIRWGLVPDMGGMVLLRDLVRGDVLRDLVYTGRIVPGTEAVAIGLATRLSVDPRADALQIAREIAARSPDAIRAAKRLLNTADEAFAARLLQTESDEQAALLGSPNQTEAVRAGLEKRAAVFGD